MNRQERRKQKSLTHKAQHYIAKGYTRAWCDPGKADNEEPYVWLFDRDGPTPESPGKRKANIFWESEMYTITPANDPQGRDLSLEHGLGRIERDFCAVRRDFIEPALPLGKRERAILLAFAACSQFRTPGFREHTRSQWNRVLAMGRKVEAHMRTATLEQKAAMARISSAGTSGVENSMTMEQVQRIVDTPLQTVLASHVRTAVPLLQRLTHLTILCTDSTPGFITSDEPVVWFDPESYRRPPLYRGPALMYETVEITMPISPTRMMFLGRQNSDWPEYMNLDALDLNNFLLDDLNRRTCRYAREKVVVSRNEFRRIWSKDGELPSDAWHAPEEGDESAA